MKEMTSILEIMREKGVQGWSGELAEVVVILEGVKEQVVVGLVLGLVDEVDALLFGEFAIVGGGDDPFVSLLGILVGMGTPIFSGDASCDSWILSGMLSSMGRTTTSYSGWLATLPMQVPIVI